MSSWEQHDLPVLMALHDHFETNKTRSVSVRMISTWTGFERASVEASLRRLAESKGPYITGTGLLASEGAARVQGLTQRAEQVIEHEAVRARMLDNHTG